MEKLVDNLFAGEVIFKNFHKTEIYLIGENFRHLANILLLFPDERFFLRYNEYAEKIRTCDNVLIVSAKLFT